MYLHINEIHIFLERIIHNASDKETKNNAWEVKKWYKNYIGQSRERLKPIGIKIYEKEKKVPREMGQHWI